MNKLGLIRNGRYTEADPLFFSQTELEYPSIYKGVRNEDKDLVIISDRNKKKKENVTLVTNSKYFF